MTGWNDVFFPSTALLRFRRWIGSADVWHFHNLHGHYLSIPLLGLSSWTKRTVISPVDQYLSTGYCTFTMDCECYLEGCGSCTRLADPWPGISRDATHSLWNLKRFSIKFSRLNMLFHTQALADHYAKTFIGRRPSRILHYGIDVHCYRPLPRADCAYNLGVKPSTRFVVGLFHSNVLESRKGFIPIINRLVDLAEALRILGKRVFIKGNIDPIHTVLHGTPEDVREVARGRLGLAAPGGAYILSTACSVPPGAPPENILAMGEAIAEFITGGV